MNVDNSKLRLVLVEWEDSMRPDPAWRYLSDLEAPKIVVCISVGYLVHDGIDIKSVAPNLGNVYDEETAQASGIIHIPACAVKKITNLFKDETATC